MAFAFHRWLISAALLTVVACSERKSAPTQLASPPAQAPDSATAVAPAPAAPAPAPIDTSDVQDVAAYLAGMPVKQASPLRTFTATPGWQRFAADADKSWTNYDATRTSKIEDWAKLELDSVRRTSPVVFYPFSGPDLLNAATVFPQSGTYVLVGLEPVGTVPGQASLESPKLYNAVKTSLWSVLNFSFFRTNSMAVDLKSLELDGSLPLILLFAARTHHQITSVKYLRISPEGQALPADSAQGNAKLVPGVEVAMRAADGHEQKVYYFSADLSDWKLGQTKGSILQYVRSLGPLTTYVKSATYLMHKPYFSQVRNLILERSRYVLQDDSGIAMKYFKPADWQFIHYGTYRRPIPMFAKHYQPALTAAYRDSVNKARPLPFGTGYNWRVNDSNLLLAKHRVEPAS
ncbi:hypothetical protein LJ737_22415 [Hymenobacter sp. 15J16-1T3B]|uniref:hypothetical protein n=1 Tax=Hymenobacter sp. 15J16-1T3B TaxID=2886941 RepID=UPI001D0FA52B|nr:hypothetical protein [Hymenobacter sp. 15J16-1T3B]MCC3160008.1 hypothetical protein [Hymenobacter sp. 15J16-1T3B]